MIRSAYRGSNETIAELTSSRISLDVLAREAVLNNSEDGALGEGPACFTCLDSLARVSFTVALRSVTISPTCTR